MKQALLAASLVLAAVTALAAPAFVVAQDRPHDRGVGAILYANSDFRGDHYVVEGNYMRDLANTGFNDRAQSLRVERGYWIFCSDAGFQGTCRTFGPGSYATLGYGLDNKVSSGRRISSDYPYNGAPNWDARR